MRTFILFLCVVLGVFAGFDADAQDDAARRFSASQNLNATLEPYRTADVSSEVPGTIKEVKFKEGDLIKEGEPVFILDPERYRETVGKCEGTLASLEADLKKAQSDLKIFKDLFALKAGTRQDISKAEFDVESFEGKVKASKEELAIAKKELNDSVVKAPFTGYMAERFKKAGEGVEKFTPLFTLSDLTKLYAVAKVEDKYVASFEKGAPTVFHHPSGKTYKGEVERVGAVIDQKDQTRKIFAVFDNSSADLSSGIAGTLRVEER